MSVQIYARKNTPVSVRRLSAALKQLLSYLKMKEAELELSLVGAKTITRLNQQYRGKAQVTDVLSFPLENRPPAAGPWHLGEVVIATSVAKRQAKQNGRGLNEQVLRLTVHGLVHLMGYDHEKGPAARRDFEIMETRFLKYLHRKGYYSWDGSLQL